MSVAASAGEHVDARVARPPRKGRLRQENLTDTERRYAVAMHLSPLAFAVLTLGTVVSIPPLLVAPPLVLWLMRRDESVFNDDHGREAINFTLSFMLWGLAAFVAVFIGIGLVLLPVLCVVGIVNCIRGAIAAGNSEYFRYPMTIRFLT